jgi:hypothetical protein
MSAISHALRGQESEHTQEAIRVIDIILRQHSAKQYVFFHSIQRAYFANLMILFDSFLCNCFFLLVGVASWFVNHSSITILPTLLTLVVV